MKKILTLILASVLLASSCATKLPPVVAPNVITQPVIVADKVAQSISRFSITLQDGREAGSCTAFSIAPRKFMTAAHCVPDALYDFFGTEFKVRFKIDGVWAIVIKKDVDRDLAVVVADSVKPDVTFRDEPLQRFEKVNGVGYGYGFPDGKYLVTDNMVIVTSLSIPIGEGRETRDSWPGTVFMGSFIGGMSGGPISDMNGLIVGVVQAGDSQTGYGVDVSTIKEFLAAK